MASAKKIILALAVLFLHSCASMAQRQQERASMAMALIQPFLQQAETQRALASQRPNSDLVHVYLPDGGQTKIAHPKFVVPLARLLDAQELLSLRVYLELHHEALGAKIGNEFSLEFLSQTIVGSNVYVRFQQVTQRNMGRQIYKLPIDGATVVATANAGKIKHINSSLATPPDIKSAFLHPGIQFSFTDTELANFIGQIKRSEASAQLMKTYLEAMSRISGRPFVFDEFLNRQLPEQRILLNNFFGSLGERSVARFFIDAAVAKKLSLVRYGNSWFLQLNGLFELPIQFDVVISDTPKMPLYFKNFRSNTHKIATVRGFQSPHFPGGKKLEGGESALKAAANMQRILQYYTDHFGWSGYAGKDSLDEVAIHTRLKSVDFRENAAWLGTMKKFVVGEGGSNLFQLDDSISVLGHEFSHAILQFSSGLVYRGESGALNEHFADIEGASIEATLDRNEEFDYTIGADVLTPAVKEEKEKLLALIYSKFKYKPEEKKSFLLDRVGLRHLYAPVLSYATQYDNMGAVLEAYSSSCQPSVDNDNCGVHTVSGVPNKAASLIISILGLKETRSLFFNTLVYRLNQYSNFNDYIVQLYDECLETPAIANRCDVVLASFAAVGIQHPKFGLQVSKFAGFPEKVNTSLPGALPAPLEINDEPSPAVSSDQASTPLLKFCGWVDISRDENIRIFDDRFNSVITTRNHAIKTLGEFDRVKKMDCACVQGRVTQIPDIDGKIFNAFTEVTAVENRGFACSLEPWIRNKRPEKIPEEAKVVREADEIPRTYCGWVSVNSRTRNVTIIDNRFDAAFLASGYPALTKGEYSSVYKNQCACVTAKLGLATNSKGTVFNFFTELSGNGVVRREYDRCIGLEWR